MPKFKDLFINNKNWADIYGLAVQTVGFLPMKLSGCCLVNCLFIAM